MKCIKEKCRYYHQHDFMASIGECKLGINFKNDKDVDCIIDSHIDNMHSVIDDCKKYKKYIKNNQKK